MAVFGNYGIKNIKITPLPTNAITRSGGKVGLNGLDEPSFSIDFFKIKNQIKLSVQELFGRLSQTLRMKSY